MLGSHNALQLAAHVACKSDLSQVQDVRSKNEMKRRVLFLSAGHFEGVNYMTFRTSAYRPAQNFEIFRM